MTDCEIARDELQNLAKLGWLGTRHQVHEFHEAFGRPVRDSLTELSPEERILRGKLLLEEVLEHLMKGLGLELSYGPTHSGTTIRYLLREKLQLRIDNELTYDPIETAEGLADINVIVHGTALHMGIDLDAVTAEVHRSNMSKLDGDGNPIINEAVRKTCHCFSLTRGIDSECPACNGTGDVIQLLDPSQPVGKILKGAHYFKPRIAKVIGVKA